MLRSSRGCAVKSRARRERSFEEQSVEVVTG